MVSAPNRSPHPGAEHLVGELRQPPIRAVKDDRHVVAHDAMREGRGAFFVTALTCGQGTNRTRIPALGSATQSNSS